MWLSLLPARVEYEEETIDYALFCCPRVAWIWRMVNLLSEMKDSPT